MKKNKKKILILDHGSGNVSSVAHVLKKLDHKYKISKSYSDLENYNYLIIPGVGSYDNCTDNLRKLNLINPIKKFSRQNKKILGICVGMQILSTIGKENIISNGLNLIPGTVEKMKVKENVILPHIGWNNILIKKKSPLLEKISTDDYFYFLHSYVFNSSEKYILSKTNYGNKKSTSIVTNNKNIYGVQFHPERSQHTGLKIFHNFLNLC